MLIDKADADDSADYEEESSNYDDDDADHGSGDDDETFGWLLVPWSHGGVFQFNFHFFEFITRP